MKHINITNWQGNITDWTKFNYVYGGLDDTLADKVNLRIPGTNLRNYIKKSDNLLNATDVKFNYESATQFFVRVWKSPYSKLLGYKISNWSTTSYNTFSFTLTEATTVRIQWGYNDVGFAQKDIDLPAGTYYFGCNYSNISNTATFSNNGIYKTAPTTYEPYGSMVLVENVGTVDLGSLDYEYQSGNIRFRTTLSDYKKTTSQSTIITALSSMYKIVTWIDSYSQDDMCLCGYSIEYGQNQYIYIRNTNYTDATTFKSAMNGVYLTYELATPKVTVFGSVDLGTLTYERTKWGKNYVFQTALNDMAKTPANNVNLSCPNYSTVRENYLYGNVADKVMTNNTSANMNLKIVDNAYTNVNAFKSAMNGVIMLYESVK